MPRTTAVLIGERPEREIVMLTDALVRHHVRTAAFVADNAEDEAAARSIETRGTLTLLPAVRCDVPLSEAGKTRFPIESSLTGGAQGWLVSGPTSCARDVLRDLGRVLETKNVANAPVVATTLEAGVPTNDVPRRVTVLAASAGVVPVLAAKPEEANDEDVKHFMERFGSRPSYWTALGRDSGALAKAALAPLPADATTDVKAVAQRRAIVQAGLLATRVRLWTTDDKGVGVDRVLPRALRIVTWQHPTKK
jgi:hypothetical protein